MDLCGTLFQKGLQIYSALHLHDYLTLNDRFIYLSKRKLLNSLHGSTPFVSFQSK